MGDGQSQKMVSDPSIRQYLFLWFNLVQGKNIDIRKFISPFRTNKFK